MKYILITIIILITSCEDKQIATPSKPVKSPIKKSYLIPTVDLEGYTKLKDDFTMITRAKWNNLIIKKDDQILAIKITDYKRLINETHDVTTLSYQYVVETGYGENLKRTTGEGQKKYILELVKDSSDAYAIYDAENSDIIISHEDMSCKWVPYSENEVYYMLKKGQTYKLESEMARIKF